MQIIYTTLNAKPSRWNTCCHWVLAICLYSLMENFCYIVIDFGNTKIFILHPLVFKNFNATPSKNN